MREQAIYLRERYIALLLIRSSFVYICLVMGNSYLNTRKLYRVVSLFTRQKIAITLFLLCFIFLLLWNAYCKNAVMF